MTKLVRVMLVYAVSMLLLLAVMVWFSGEMLTLEREHEQALANAAMEERIRLALWRIDSAVGRFLAEENSQPYYAYQAFYPVDQPYNRMLNADSPDARLTRSPLATKRSPFVLLYFQFGADNMFHSPQVSEDRLSLESDDAESFEFATRLESLRSVHHPEILRKRSLPPETISPPPIVAPSANQSVLAAQTQSQLNFNELNRRAGNYTQTTNSKVVVADPSGEVREGWLQPFWQGHDLFCVRRVNIGEQELIQGVWVDWNAFKRSLLNEVKDLHDGADLEYVGYPVHEIVRSLATLPVRLTVPEDYTLPDWDVPSPFRPSIMIPWACVLLAALAIGVLLFGAVVLSERRGDFVSAVTHELRTPITTFRMYTDLLADGMVTDAAQQKEYFETLRGEAERLGHLVENVLAYARLERGRGSGTRECCHVGSLTTRIAERLRHRCAAGNMKLVLDLPEDVSHVAVKTDPLAVEQILFNLIDNACKYAASAKDRRVELLVRRRDSSIEWSVRDHGDGLARRKIRQLFRPFSKSAQTAAQSAPGIGLGLALSRRLARSLGGALHLDSAITSGAAFVFSLPVISLAEEQ